MWDSHSVLGRSCSMRWCGTKNTERAPSFHASRPRPSMLYPVLKHWLAAFQHTTWGWVPVEWKIHLTLMVAKNVSWISHNWVLIMVSDRDKSWYENHLCSSSLHLYSLVLYAFFSPSLLAGFISFTTVIFLRWFLLPVFRTHSSFHLYLLTLYLSPSKQGLVLKLGFPCWGMSGRRRNFVAS